MLSKAIKLAKGTEEPKIGLSVQVPKSLKDDFENICKENNVSMSSMLLSLIQVAVDEIKEKENLIDEMEKTLAQLENKRQMLKKVYANSGLDELEMEDGSIMYIKKDLESLNHEIESLENDIGNLLSMKGGIER
ncbi:hypothetical protein [Sulfurimonas sp.]|uniref:hypothetical protein n=1 Tax=Sulfurimonas sp. TaxID=2022749 RepID=UPI002618B13F|nr:hypothetical protein [Sulfurimonas sp.]MDD3855393.1 hypothetical protein [Sulfurimonas sp.]